MSRRRAQPSASAEAVRLEEARAGTPWRRWGPYLAERAWGTVREDYSADGDAWAAFDHEQARSRTYRWNEDGLLGISDDQQRFCLALSLWNGADPILKERLYGVTNAEGNHGEDVKELYFFLDALPTSSYLRAAYLYPQAAFPYQQLLTENAARGTDDPEYELPDSGIFDDDRFFDVEVTYAKRDPHSMVMQVRATNLGPAPAPLHILPTAWFRNTWAWTEEAGEEPPSMRADGGIVVVDHPVLGRLLLAARAEGADGEWLFTENETNPVSAFGSAPAAVDGYTKDAFHRYVVEEEAAAVNPSQEGTKTAFHAAWTGLWDPDEQFFFDLLRIPGEPAVRLKAFSVVGLVPLFATRVLDAALLTALPEFATYLDEVAHAHPRFFGACECFAEADSQGHRLLALVDEHRLAPILDRLLDEDRFWSAHGVRSVSRRHADQDLPVDVELDGVRTRVDYEPGEARSRLKGGNSNWRGPVWLPINYMLWQALRQYGRYYGDRFQHPHPSPAGAEAEMARVARDLAERLVSLYRVGPQGRPAMGPEARWREHPALRDRLLFYEYFHAESGRGLGAAHQTGWTALLANLLDELHRTS